MSDVNYGALYLMIAVNGGLLLMTYGSIPKNTRRVYYLFSIISMFIFSGIGISYNEIGQEFLGEYLVFSSVFIITLFLILRQTKSKKVITDYDDTIIASEIETNNEELIGKWNFVIIIVIFYLTYFIFLVVPEVRISQLWNPPNATVIDGYERIISTKASGILNIALLMRTLLLPFFMVNIYRLKQRRKKFSIIILISLWVYLYYLSQVYISRYELIIYIVFLFILITSKIINKMYINRRQLTVIVVSFIFSVPALLSYQYTRMGHVMHNYTFGKTFSELMGTELQFPHFYPKTVELSNSVSAIKYFLWFVVLPIPSLLLPKKGEITVQINRIFSTSILGIEYGKTGYYGLLPSILGEAILIYDQYFFWIHAIFLAIMLGMLCRFMEKIQKLSVLNLYFAINTFAIARGGTQGYFGMVINSLAFYFFSMWVVNSSKNWRSYSV